MRRAIYDYFFLFLLALALYGVGKLLTPFVGALLVAFMCAVTFYPLYHKLCRVFPRISPSFHAALADVLVLIFFVGPLLLLMWALLRESSSLVPALKQGSETLAQWREGNLMESTPWVDHIRFFLANAFGIKRAQFQQGFVEGVNKTIEYVSVTGTLFAGHVIDFVVNLLIMLFALFFMFRDGQEGLHYLETIIPMRHANRKELITRIQVIVISVVRGLFLTSLVQGVAATIGYLIVGAEGAVLLGASTALMGLLPVVGTFGIWVPASLFFLLKGSYLKGGFLFLWGVIVVVGLVDMFVRPYLVGKKVQLPSFLLFFALLGGVEVWGAKGLFLGPLIASIAPVLLDMYRQRFSRGESVA